MSNDALHHQQELEHQQQLLTVDYFTDWLDKNVMVILLSDKRISIKAMYLAEHGLPLDSKIEGL